MTVTVCVVKLSLQLWWILEWTFTFPSTFQNTRTEDVPSRTIHGTFKAFCSWGTLFKSSRGLNLHMVQYFTI